MKKRAIREAHFDIMPKGIESAVVYAPLDKALEALTENGYEVISLAQNAQLRIQQGPHSFISRNGNWTREGVLYAPKRGAFLVPNSPIMQNAKEATQSHRKGREYSLTDEQFDQALVDSIDFPQENIKIPTDRLSEEALTVWAFGGEKEARAYGEFLRNAGIQKMPILVVDKNYVNKKENPFVRQMWFRFLGFGSGFGGYGRCLNGGIGLHGVKIGAEFTSPR